MLSTTTMFYMQNTTGSSTSNPPGSPEEDPEEGPPGGGETEEMEETGEIIIRKGGGAEGVDGEEVEEMNQELMSDEDNTSCSASEIGCDLSLTHNNNVNTTKGSPPATPTALINNNNNNDISSSSSNSRKNKRKNFKPRNILEYAGSDEEENQRQQQQLQQQQQLLQYEEVNGSIDMRINNSSNNEEEEESGVDSEEDDDDSEDQQQHQYHHRRSNMTTSSSSNHRPPPQRRRRSSTDGPLDLSDVQDYSIHGKSSSPWLRSNSSNNKEAGEPSSSAAQVQQAAAHAAASLAMRNLLSNLNNNSDPFIPLGLAASMGMDLRLPSTSSSTSRGGGGEEQESSNKASSNNNNNNHLSHLPHHHHPQLNHPLPHGHPMFQDFAENTMKELLSLYGIADLQRQGGKPTSSLDHQQLLLNMHGNLNLDIAGHHQQSSKMMIPENMARLLAAMQESSSAAAAMQIHESSSMNNNNNNNAPHKTSHNSSSSSSASNGNGNSSGHPLNFANINSLVQERGNNGGVNSCSSTSSSPNVRGSPNPSTGGGTNGTLSPSSQSPYSHHHPHHQLHSSFGPSGGGSSSGGNGHLFPPKHKSRGLAAFPIIREGLLGKGAGPIDYTRYVRRFGNSMECGYQQCREHNYREHFHCQECADGTRVFVKKEEMIRHFKWHKKRDESLQHGFMRYSPTDDCSDKFPNCSHNGKQTHYHCLKEGCEKVYISTSDVQMHANYHRKDSAIIQEGFQRFRAAEDCGSDHCTFRHQKTTHFHCRRPTCSFTFKNKADMEKHKSYHIKDEQLNRDGFKKFMKHEECQYPTCRFSRVCNHIHCIREGCNYVLHSSGQLYSHKRKHERRDAELAYRKYKLAQSLIKGGVGGIGDLPLSSFGLSSDLLTSSKSEDDNNSRSSFNDCLDSSNASNPDRDPEERMKKLIQVCGNGVNCQEGGAGVVVGSGEHFHCKVESCRNSVLTSVDIAAEHVKNHELEDKISSLAYFAVDPANFDAQDSTIPCISAKCPYQTREKHYHCLWDGCNEIVLPTDEPFKRFEHFRTHQLLMTPNNLKSSAEFLGEGQGVGVLRGASDSPGGGILSSSASPVEGGSLDGFFRRKRGRPPKNRVIEVSSGANEAIYTSFKLPKPTGGLGNGTDPESKDQGIFLSFPEGSSCSNDSCPFNKDNKDSVNNTTEHFHCGYPRCHLALPDLQKLSVHLRDFHGNFDIPEGFKYFGRKWNCESWGCTFVGNEDHFHCLRDDFSCIKEGDMMAHEAEVHGGGGMRSNTPSSTRSEDQSSDREEKDDKGGNSVVKSSGTFYPTYSLDKFKLGNNAMDLSSPSNNGNGILDQHDMKPSLVTDHSLSRILQMSSSENRESETQYGPEIACGRPFCKLKRKHHFHCHLCNQAFSELEKLRPHVLKHSNVSPPVIMKNEPAEHEQEHSNHSNNTEDEEEGDRRPNKSSSREEGINNVHHIKEEQDNKELTRPEHQVSSSSSPSSGFPKFDMGLPPSASNPFPTPTSLSNFLGYPGGPSPYLFALQQNLPLTSLYAGMMFGAAGASPFGPHPGIPHHPGHHPGASGLLPPPHHPPPDSLASLGNGPSPTLPPAPVNIPPPVIAPCSNKRPPSASPSSPSSPSEAKKARMQMRILKDEPVPDGYIRFRFNEDCQYPHCGYREHQTHFHCTREDCGYSFCDKTRFVQHTARHERLDTLMGGDFKQFRANVSCGRPDCSYKSNPAVTQAQNKASHFHCSKCEFVCTDTNKVVAHRRQHQKLDSIMAAGFEKFTPSQGCQIEGCIHSQKQTHYHCLKCGYAVLGLSQMSAHKYRHVD